MNEIPQQHRRRWSGGLLAWLIFLAVIAGCFVWVDVDADRQHVPRPPYWQEILYTVIGATLSLGLWLCIRWLLRSWRNFRRFLVGTAIFATVVAIFYTEEDWRGKRDWFEYRAELEAKGSVLDWEKYVPPHVPDDQNFFTVNTNFYLRFVKLQTLEQGEAANQLQWLNLLMDFSTTDLAKIKPVVAEISIVATADANSTAIDIHSPDATNRLQAALRNVVGRDAMGAAGFRFTEHQVTNLVPAKIVLLADSVPTAGEWEKLVPETLFPNVGKLAVTHTDDPNQFQVRFVFGSVTTAADYLAWGDRRFGANLDEVRDALKRPYAIIPGDYSESYRIPIPNFVTMRGIAQTLAQRTQCHLLLNQPDLALRDLTLIHDVCRILERPPTGKPETLVEAMINVAIHGLYVATVQDGFRLHGWQEPQLAAIQQQLAETSLIPFVAEAFREEEVHTINIGERQDFEKIATGELFGFDPKRPFWQKIPDHIKYGLMPKGWVYQNIKCAAELDQTLIGCLDDSNERVDPEKADLHNQAVSKSLEIHSVFHLLANIAIPNFSKAMQTCAYNQTQVNEGQIACALERYKMANGNYPETLDALVPQFIEKIPHDIIGGQPLHYHRTDDPPTQSSGAASGKFLLYSVGWNETDDGGLWGTLKDVKMGDWVWKY